MTVQALDSGVAASIAAAASQESQLAIIMALFPGNISVRYYSAAGVLLDTVVYAGWVLSATTPRYITPGAYVSRTLSTPGTASYAIVAISGGADVLRVDVALSGTVAAAYRTNLGTGSGANGLRVTASSALPVNSVPAWLSGVEVNQAVEIANTQGTLTGLAERNYDAFNGWAVRDSTAELIVAAYGGHDDGNDNRVSSINLKANAPVWTLRTAASPVPVRNAAYAADGKPGSRHVYTHNHFSEQANRLFMVGARFVWGDGPPSFQTVDAWNPDTNTWEPAGSSPDSPSGFGVVQVSGGRIWTTNGRFFDTTTRVWGFLAESWTGGTPSFDAVPRRFPVAYDSTRDQTFGLQFGDGQGFNLEFGIIAYRKNLTTGALTAITWSSGSAAAVAQFTTDAPTYAGMAYCPVQDKFFFHAGVAGRVYVVTPNSGSVWDMSILTVAGLTAGIASGINGHMRYVSGLAGVSGIAIHPRATSNIIFLRTA